VPPIAEGGACGVGGWDEGRGEGACGTGAEEAIVGKEVVAASEPRLGDVGVDDRDFLRRGDGAEGIEGRGESLEGPLERGVGGAAGSRTSHMSRAIVWGQFDGTCGYCDRSLEGSRRMLLFLDPGFHPRLILVTGG